MKFLDLFAGIGGFRMGMEMAGHECVGFVEWDKYARQSYEAIYDVKGEWTAHDITEVSNEQWREFNGKVDVICAGFPCQAFSVAGKRGGFHDTRGTLFFEVARAAKEIKPRILLLENVKGLLSHDKGFTFGTILNTLDELGYDAEWEVLNSKDYVPQNRERVFIIGRLRGTSTGKLFPFGRTYGEAALSNEVIERKDPEIVIPVLTPGRAEKRQNGRRFKEDGEPMFTLTAQDKHGIMIREATKKGYAIATEGDSINLAVPTSKTRRGRVGKGIASTLDTTAQLGVLTDLRIRRLTPKESWRLQGFPDWAFEKAQDVCSSNQLYIQAGNSVTVNVVYEIAKRLR